MVIEPLSLVGLLAVVTFAPYVPFVLEVVHELCPRTTMISAPNWPDRYRPHSRWIAILAAFRRINGTSVVAANGVPVYPALRSVVDTIVEDQTRSATWVTTDTRITKCILEEVHRIGCVANWIPAYEPPQLSRVKAGPSVVAVARQRTQGRAERDFPGFRRCGAQVAAALRISRARARKRVDMSKNYL